MNTKHTPGPWTLKVGYGTPLQILGAPTARDPRYNPVTRCGTTFIAPTSEESMANARLIAAAPSMLEALEFYADTSKYPAPKTGGFGELYFDCGTIAKAAIAKATGKESA